MKAHLISTVNNSHQIRHNPVRFTSEYPRSSNHIRFKWSNNLREFGTRWGNEKADDEPHPSHRHRFVYYASSYLDKIRLFVVVFCLSTDLSGLTNWYLILDLTSTDHLIFFVAFYWGIPKVKSQNITHEHLQLSFYNCRIKQLVIYCSRYAQFEFVQLKCGTNFPYT